MPRAGATGNSTRDASYKKKNTGRSKKKQRRATTPQNSVTVIRDTIERMLRAGAKKNTGRKKKPAEGAVQKKTKIQKKR